MGRRFGIFVCLVLGCEAASPEPTTASLGARHGDAGVTASAAAIPATPEAVLAELAPLAGGAVVVVYDVIGPAGMTGSLEILAAAGGYRRDNWVIRLPLPDGPREIRGSAIQTPDASWRAEGESVGAVEPGRLGALASAIVGLDPISRGAVIGEIQRFRDELALGRIEDPGERDTVAGVPCVRVRAGGGEVCTWEEAGLPLRYDGAAFSIVASHIEHGAELGTHAFDIPPDAARSPLAAPTPDLRSALAQVLAGDRAELVRLLVVDSFPSLSSVPATG